MGHADLLNPKAGISGRHKRNVFRRRGAKSSIANSTSRFGDDEEMGTQQNEPVSHIVVDNNFDHFTPAMAKSDSGSTNQTPAATAKSTGEKSSGNDLGFSNGEDDADNDHEAVGSRSDVASVRRDRRSTWVQRTVERSFQKEVSC